MPRTSKPLLRTDLDAGPRTAPRIQHACQGRIYATVKSKFSLERRGSYVLSTCTLRLTGIEPLENTRATHWLSLSLQTFIQWFSLLWILAGSWTICNQRYRNLLFGVFMIYSNLVAVHRLHMINCNFISEAYQALHNSAVT